MSHKHESCNASCFGDEVLPELNLMQLEIDMGAAAIPVTTALPSPAQQL